MRTATAGGILSLFLFSGFGQSPDLKPPPETESYMDVAFRKGDLFIDDIRPQEIRVRNPSGAHGVSIDSIQDLPLRIAILMDASGSQRPFGKDNRELYLNLIRLMPLRPVDAACLFSFSVRINLVQDMTSDKNLLIRGIEALHYSGQTKLADAILLAADALRNQGDSRKAVIVFTDGMENLSEHGIKQALAVCIRNNIRLCFLLRMAEPERYLVISGQRNQKVKNAGRSFHYNSVQSGHERIAQVLDELSHLMRIRLAGMTAEKLGSKIEMSVSRKGVQALYMSEKQ